MIRVGGTFKAARFGKATSVDITDAEGKVHIIGRSEGGETTDPGNPKAPGLLAIREDKGETCNDGVVAVRPSRLRGRDRLLPSGRRFAVPGRERFVPDPGLVRDGKGRKTIEDRQWIPKVVVRD